MGPSGSGKSTLMHLLGCLDRPTTGALRIAGADVSSLDDTQLAQLRNETVGFVFQSFQLLPRISATANVAMPLVYRGTARAERIERARAALESVGLGHRLDHRPTQLSGGEQQRVAIARSLVTNPSMLMGDEPTGNLDSKTSREVIGLFKKLNEERQITVILVTHDLNVARHARRILVMRDGKIEMDTTRFEEAFESLHAFETIPAEEETSVVQPEQAE